MEDRNPAVLLLEDGTCYYGKSIGKKGTAKVTISSNNYEDKIIKIKVS